MAETLVSKIVANAGKNWSRNTVADGNWLNANTIVKLNQNDKTLAEAIDSLSASMPHILPEYPGFKLDLQSNETIKSIEQKTTGELVVEKQGIDIESSTLNDKLWAHLQTNKGCPVNNEYTKLYDEGEDPPDLNYLEPGDQGDGCTTSNLILKPGIYSIYIELAYKPGNNIERIEKELSVRLCKGIDPIANAEFTFHCNDTYTEINQHRLVNAVVKFEEEGTLVIQGKTESGHAGGTLQIVNLYIVSVGGATGPKGDEGDPGADGFSPIVEITEGTHQHTIKITDKTHSVTTLINDGADGSNGKSVELSANPLNAHLNWRQEGDTNWTDTGYAISGAVGPRGSDGTSPTVTSTPNPNVGGYDVTFHYGDTLEDEETITVPSGVSGNPGISPSISTSAIPGTPGGTTVIITDATHPESNPLTFDIRNGIDGTGATYDFDTPNTISGDGSQNSPYGVNTDYAFNFTDASAKSAYFATRALYQDHNYDIGYELYGLSSSKLDKPTSVQTNEKHWLIWKNAQGESSWSEAETWLANSFSAENGISAHYDAANGKVKIGANTNVIPTKDWLVDNYLPLSGGRVKGVIELSGSSFDNAKLHLVRNEVSNTVDVGIGSNGEAVLKSAVPNNGYAQLMLSKNTNTNYPDIKIKIDDNGANHKVMSVPETEYNNMVQSANQNLVSGPNYTLAKTANGFTIGAALVNCTNINDVTLAPNTYYFVYEV